MTYEPGSVLPRLITHPKYEAGMKAASEYVQRGHKLDWRRTEWLETVDAILADLHKHYGTVGPYLRGYFRELSYYQWSQKNGTVYLPMG